MPNPITLRAIIAGLSYAPSYARDLLTSLLARIGLGTPAFTRATVASLSDFEGNIKSVPSGCMRESGARFVYNSLLYSQDFTNVAWTMSQTTSAASAILSPDGVSFWQTLVESGANSQHQILQFKPTVAGQGVYSCHAMDAGATGRYLTLYPQGITTGYAIFDLKNGVVTGTGGTNYLASGMIPLSGGGYRCWIRWTSSVNAATAFVSYLSNNSTTPAATYAGDGASKVYIWGAQYDNVTGQIVQTPGEYQPTNTGAPNTTGADGCKYYATKLDGTPIADATMTGGLFEQAGTQILATADIRDMTTANWTLGATMTRARTSIGADGAANSATRLTGGAVAATNIITYLVTAAATSRTYSCLIKRITGSGPVRLTEDGFATNTDISGQLVLNTWVLVPVTQSQLNAVLGIKIDTNGDAIDVDMNQFEAGAIASSRMLTTGAARNADVEASPLPGNLGTTGWIAQTVTWQHAPSGTGYLWGSYTDANNALQMLHDGTNAIARVRVGGVNYDATIPLAYVAGTPAKIAIAFGSSRGVRIAVNGVLGTTNAYSGPAVLAATCHTGDAGDGTGQPYANCKLQNYGNTDITDAALIALTV